MKSRRIRSKSKKQKKRFSRKFKAGTIPVKNLRISTGKFDDFGKPADGVQTVRDKKKLLINDLKEIIDRIPKQNEKDRKKSLKSLERKSLQLASIS